MRIALVRLLALAVMALPAAQAQRGPAPGGLELRTDDGGSYWLTSVSFHTETEIVEHKVVNEQGVEVVVKVPGRLKWGDVEITRTLAGDASWASWRKQVEDGYVAEARQAFSIIAYDVTLQPIAQWDFDNGWPAQLQVQSQSSSNITERLLIVHEGLQAVTVTPPAPNRSPTISMPSSFSTPVGDTTTFIVTASDPDSDPVVLANILAPAGATFSGGIFSWSVPLQAIDSVNTVSFRADDQQGESNSITTKQLTITVPRDFDNDSLDDDWEIIWLGGITASAGHDEDDDRQTNLDEFISGTNPTNAASYFHVTDLAQSNQTLWIHYTGEPGRNYQLECNTNSLPESTGWQSIGAPWTESATNSSPRSFSIAQPDSSNAFYRIRVQR